MIGDNLLQIIAIRLTSDKMLRYNKYRKDASFVNGWEKYYTKRGGIKVCRKSNSWDCSQS